MSEHPSPPSGVHVPIALQVDADGGNDDDNTDADSSLGAVRISSFLDILIVGSPTN